MVNTLGLCATGENFKAKAWERLCRRKLLLNKHSIRIHKLIVSFPWIAPIGGLISEVKATPQRHE